VGDLKDGVVLIPFTECFWRCHNAETGHCSTRAAGGIPTSFHLSFNFSNLIAGANWARPSWLKPWPCSAAAASPHSLPILPACERRSPCLLSPCFRMFTEHKKRGRLRQWCNDARNWPSVSAKFCKRQTKRNENNGNGKMKGGDGLIWVPLRRVSLCVTYVSLILCVLEIPCLTRCIQLQPCPYNTIQFL
jgi:hypothetical protein